MSDYQGETNGDLAEYTAVMRSIMNDCSNANYNAYRAWLEGNQ